MNPFIPLLRYLYRFFHPRKAPNPGSTQYKWSETHPCRGTALEINLSSVMSPGALPEHLVDAVRRLKPFLPVGCEVLGQGDLKVIGSRPVDAGGFADIWVGERHDGTVVAIKSHRYHSTSSCRSIYLVSHWRHQAVVRFTR